MEKNKKHYLLNINPFVIDDGFLAVIEEKKQIPFKIKRIFYEYDFKENAIRGMHANKKSRFCFIAITGSCEIIVDDGKNKVKYKLDKPNTILFLDRMIWKTMTNFSDDCVLLVLSDCVFDKEEYVRDYNEYLSLIHSL